MEKIFKNFVAIFIAVFFIGCSSYSPLYKADDKNLSVKIDKDKYYKLPAKEDDSKRYLESCVFDSLYLKENSGNYNFSLDYIDLKMNCEWSGFSKGQYLSHLTDSNKITTLTLMQKYENENIDISKYKTNKGCSFYLIGIYGLGEQIFIVDKTGAISKDILKELKSDMKVSIDQVCLEDELELKDSIIKNNFFFKYFKQEDRDRDYELWILEK